MSRLKLIVLNNISELGENVNKYLQELNKTNTDYKIKISSDRFSNGEGKVFIKESVNGTDLYILSDV